MLCKAKVEEYEDVETIVSHDEYDHETLRVLNILLQAFLRIIALQFNRV